MPSLEGSWYYITFIDDHSRNCVYFFSKKSNVFNVFKKLKALVKIEIDLKLKCLRSNNVREYINGGFKEYYVAHYIRMERPSSGPHNKMVLLSV